RNLPLHIDIAIADKIEFNGIGSIAVNKSRCSIHFDVFALEVFAGGNRRSFIQNSLNIALKISHEALIAFAGNHCKHIDVMNTVTAAFCIHSGTMLVYTEAQTTTHFLAFRCLTVRMLQRTNLKYIWVIPPFSQSRVGKDKACRLVKGQQTFFVLQNQIVSGNIVRKLTATLQLTVDTSAGLFVNTEISFVNRT